MQTSLRLLLFMLMAAWAGAPLLAATTSKTQKSSSKSSATSGKKSASSKPKSEDATDSKYDTTPAKKTTPSEPVNEDPATPVPTPAVVSTLSIEDIRDFNSYPKQIQSLVQSCLALTHLDLGYMYGSHEPSKGGMDCSGTIYHVLHFQGLKDVPRQSDEMCNWVDKKSQLHLTPTATDFDSEEFKDLKPGDLLFWTNSLETTRKLPVTHVMVYLGKLKKTGKRVVFGSSDGRSYMGERRSGVSVFDFSLPRPESTKHFYGYGPTPGLMPPEPKPEQPVVLAAASTTTTPASKEATVIKDTPVSKTTPAPAAPKETVVVKETPAAKTTTVALKESAQPKETPAVKEEPPAPKEEVRKAVAIATDSPSQSEVKKTTAAETVSKPKTTTTTKPKTSTVKKRSTSVASSTRRRTPPAPQKSVFQQRVDQTVSSVRRFFQR